MQGHQHHNKALLVSKCQRLWWITFRRLSSAIELSWPISLILFGQNKEILLAIAHIHYILGIVCITKVSKESNLIPDMVIPFGPFWIPLDPFWIPLDPFGSPSPIQFHIFTLSNSTFNPLQWCLMYIMMSECPGILGLNLSQSRTCLRVRVISKFKVWKYLVARSVQKLYYIDCQK